MRSTKKSEILAYLPEAFRDTPHTRRLVAVGAVSLFAAVAAVAVSVPQVPPPTLNVLEQLPLPAYEFADAADGTFLREGQVERGDTLASVLARLGVQDTAVLQFVASNAEARTALRALRPGVRVLVGTSRMGELQSVSLPQQDADSMLVIARDGSGFVLGKEAMRFDTRVRTSGGEIRSSLFAATDAAGLPDSLAVEMANVFGNQINFHSDLRRGDRFKVVYETLHYHGALVRTGRVLAAEFVNDGKRHTAVWFVGENGKGAYYSAEGRPLQSGFLRSPLEFSRVSSGFSMRLHPILKQWRAHKGVDYAAGTGTRVKATADGVVDFAGRQGGYGNIVVLRHAHGITTAYGHLNGFAKGLRQGSRVSQGEVIGFVGATGWATGPHLHYEFRAHGIHKDPLRVALPEAPPLLGAQMEVFRAHSADALARLEAAQAADVALAD